MQQKHFFVPVISLRPPQIYLVTPWGLSDPRLGTTRLSPSGFNKRIWPWEVLHDVTPQQLPSSNMGVFPPLGNT